MKSLLALIFCLILVTFAADTFAEELDKYRTYVAKDTEEIYTTWVNLEVKPGRPRKLIYKANSIVEWFMFDRSVAPDYIGRYLILKKWKDSEGNIWYKIHSVNPTHEYYSLIKISNSGNILEIGTSSFDYPIKIDPKHVFYNKYSRE
jgi:hypothetical protein